MQVMVVMVVVVGGGHGCHGGCHRGCHGGCHGGWVVMVVVVKVVVVLVVKRELARARWARGSIYTPKQCPSSRWLVAAGCVFWSSGLGG